MSKERKKPDEQLNDVDIENQSGDNIVICREALLFTHDHLGVPHDIDRGHDDDEEGNDVVGMINHCNDSVITQNRETLNRDSKQVPHSVDKHV